MYEEEEKYNFNWLNLFIKVVVFVIFVLLGVWLISKIALRNKNDDTEVTVASKMEANLERVNNALINYFEDVALPSETGDRITLTLKQMIEKKIVNSVTDSDGKTCDEKESYAELTKIDTYYVLKTSLTCGEEKDYVYVTIGDKNCKICDKKVLKTTETTTKKEETTNKNTTNNNSTTNKNTTTETTKSTTTETTKKEETTTKKEDTTVIVEKPKIITYSDWIIGYKTGNNIENDTHYISYTKMCKEQINEYHTVSYIYKSASLPYKYSYQVLLKDYPITRNDVSVYSERYFNTNDYSTYIATQNQKFKTVGATTKDYGLTASNIKNSALTSSNFTHKVGVVNNGENIIQIDITVNNINNVTAYNKIFFVPVYFQIKFIDIDSCIEVETSKISNYSNYVKNGVSYTKKTNVYRYVYES